MARASLVLDRSQTTEGNLDFRGYTQQRAFQFDRLEPLAGTESL